MHIYELLPFPATFYHSITTPIAVFLIFSLNFETNFSVMKKTHIVALFLVAIMIGVLVVLLGDFSRYETFESNYAKKGKEINVVGVLNKEKGITYEPTKDPNVFSMYIIDADGVEKQVIVKKAKPRDIERSEKIVVIGRMKDDVFIADDILMKCPSKYQEKTNS
jgi:cytochrome c-type biogenesis protein CcmE